VVEAQQSRPLKGRLAHGVLTMLRGLQLAAIYTGDASWNKQPEQFRKEIADVIAWPDGNISEVFPNSSRNEGCAIADWVMLNLYAGFISGEDEAYEKAENALWNALFLNQMVNGGFGHRDYESDHTYGGAVLSMECWFCCLHNAGLAMVEFADHAVTLRGDELRINLLVPGRYRLPYKGTTIEVEVSTRYPEKADTTVVISGAPKEMKTRIRIPSCIKGAEVKVTNLPGAKTRHVLSGRMGYQLEEVKNGVVLRYGPLVMAPLRYAQNVKRARSPAWPSITSRSTSSWRIPTAPVKSTAFGPSVTAPPQLPAARPCRWFSPNQKLQNENPPHCFTPHAASRAARG
jgi:hypothetical protein